VEKWAHCRNTVVAEFLQWLLVRLFLILPRAQKKFRLLGDFKTIKHNHEIGLALATRAMTINGIGPLSGMFASRHSSPPMVTL
jgi:hypothetical protein